MRWTDEVRREEFSGGKRQTEGFRVAIRSTYIHTYKHTSSLTLSRNMCKDI